MKRSQSFIFVHKEKEGAVHIEMNNNNNSKTDIIKDLSSGENEDNILLFLLWKLFEVESM